MRWLEFVVLVLVLIVAVDVLGRQFLTGKADLYLASSHDDSTTLFVYFPGILADGQMSFKGILPTVCQRGDALLVTYAGKRFEAKTIVDQVAANLRIKLERGDYDTVVFLGSSMGGLLAYDTYQLLKAEPGVRFEFVLMDAPTGRKDLQSPLDKISLGAWLWWAGPLSNLISKPYFNATFVAPKEENIEPGVDREQLAANVEQAKSYPLSWSMDQPRYIMGHGQLKTGSLWEVRVIYVRSTRDTDTVRVEAADNWIRATCRNPNPGGFEKPKDRWANALYFIEIDTTHVGFAERPQTWITAFEQRILPKL